MKNIYLNFSKLNHLKYANQTPQLQVLIFESNLLVFTGSEFLTSQKLLLKYYSGLLYAILKIRWMHVYFIIVYPLFELQNNYLWLRTFNLNKRFF